MDIFEKTRELGEMIQNSEEMKKYKEAEEKQAQDENAQAALQEFNIKRMNLARDMQNGKLSREEAVKQNTDAFNAVLEKSEAVKNYIDAKKEFDEMVQKINGIINFYITGQDPSCTHNCSTCGGCH